MTTVLQVTGRAGGRSAPSDPAGGRRGVEGPPRSTIRWPPPLPGRARWAWLLGTRWRGWRLRPLLRLLDGRVPSGAWVISVGSGPGFDLARLARRIGRSSARWALLEPQSDMWVGARRLNAIAGGPWTPSRVRADGVDLPLRSGSVDVVLSLGVLCCMTDAAVPAAVAEIVRVLRPGGWLLFTVPARRGAADEARWEAAGLIRAVRLRPGRCLLRKPI